MAGLDDLLAAVRAGEGGLIPEMRRLAVGEVVLLGNLVHLPTTDLLNFLHQGRVSGVLFARSEGVERALVLDDGNVAWGVSTSPAERFGEILARQGKIERGELARALRAQSGGAGMGRIGEMLVTSGALPREELPRALRRQVVEIFLGLLVVRQGECLLFEGFDRERLPVSEGIDTEALLLDGLRRMDEMELFRARIPGLHVKPRRTGKPFAEEAGIMGAREIVDLSDGTHTLGDLATRTALGEFEATKTVFKLLGSGHLALLP